MLILASQRIEDVLGWDGEEGGGSSVTKRGAKPSLVESCILAWVTGTATSLSSHFLLRVSLTF